jgi:hypothetical protein
MSLKYLALKNWYEGTISYTDRNNIKMDLKEIVLKMRDGVEKIEDRLFFFG